MMTTGMTTMEIKKINKSKVYHLIYDSRAISKQGIASALQMGMNTVTQNLKLLEEEGLIERNGYFESTGGRKAQSIRILPRARISLGIEILRKTLHIAAVDLYGRILEQESYPLPFHVSDAYCEKVGQKVNAFTEKYRLPRQQILGAAIAMQGLISTDGTSVSYGRVLDHTGMKLSDFARHIPYPCRLEHDSKAAGYLETWHQKKFRDSIVVLLNQNLGGAVILDGKVHNGLGMHSGSIEHMCINPDGPLCYCGERGCLETYCSADSLERAAGTGIPAFFGQLRLGTPAFIKIWEDYLRHLAFAICNLNVVLDCYVIISGYLAPYFLPEDLERITHLITDASPYKQQKDFIFLSTHGQLAPPVGAALYYIDEFLHEI